MSLDTADELISKGWYHPRRTLHGVAADSDERNAGYIIEAYPDGRYTIWHQPHEHQSIPIAFPPGPLPTPLEAAAQHEQARYRQ